jgi:hypothetical protein
MLAADDARQKDRPDRHGVGEDGDARGGCMDLGKRDQHGEADDVEQSGDDDVQPGARAVDPQAALLQARNGAYGQGAEERGRDPHAEWRDLVERDPHRRPGDPPDQAQRGEHQSRADDFFAVSGHVNPFCPGRMEAAGGVPARSVGAQLMTTGRARAKAFSDGAHVLQDEG